ncbi:LiaF transmembrane domain-containing protein [Fictibacillus gelatini]|uniref:LiaF transmembrane domain-containing protein n=1 Tax=Fictibacillus gelatini TaxID=225985 RepID=UPI00040403FA|nr:DUF5668 domain-containing protein [Fictibacillus gelatini]
MRRWRVGTISMGLSLVFLGSILLLSQFNKDWTYNVFVVWWPAILIILGLEMLIYYFLKKEENALITYDFLSIFFVAVIGTIGIGMTFLQSTGFIDELKKSIKTEYKTYELPAFKKELDGSVKNVVLEVDQHVNIESSSANDIQLFGTYFGEQQEIQTAKDYVTAKTAGNTLYVIIKNPPVKTGMFQQETRINPTMIVPKNVNLDVRGDHQGIAVYPNQLENDWRIEDAGHVAVRLDEKAKMNIKAETYSALPKELNWINKEKIAEDGDQSPMYKGTYGTGKDEPTLSITSSDELSIRK